MSRPKGGPAAEWWRARGVSDTDAERLRWEPLTGKEVAELADNFTTTPAVRLPYWTTEGEPSGFYRVRYLEKPDGFAGLIAKPQRYAQPAGTLNEVYLPPLLDEPWTQVLSDTALPLVITEGEAKSACACLRGYPCIGLGGVDVYRSSKRGMELLPALRDAEWNGREVAIVFDSDASTNPNVTRAQRRLAQTLADRGASPRIVALPPGPEGAKQGLDDFLVAGGDLRPLIDAAEPFEEAAALWGLNEEVLYVKDPGLVVVQATGQRMSPGAFETHAYAPRTYVERGAGPKGQPTFKVRPLAPRWLRWPARFEVERVTYAPGKPVVTGGLYNMWRGMGAPPVKGDVGPWTALLDYVFQIDPDAREWFEDWVAYPIQVLGAKMFTATVMWSAIQGTGKTLLAYTIANMYGRPNWIEIKSKDLKGGFNGWAENKQFVIGDEITGGEARIDADYLKGLITQDSLLVNQKYIPSFTIPDCINYFFTSNHPDALFLEDSDRRFFVHEVVGKPLERAFYEAYNVWFRSPEGQSALMYYLLERNLGNFNPRAEAPDTRSKSSMIRDSKSDLGNWVLMLREDPERALAPLGPEAARSELLTPTQMLHAYDPEKRTRVTVVGLGKEMKRSGYRQVNGEIPVRTRSMGLQRLWAVRNGVYWSTVAKPAQIAEAFDKVFGQGKEKHT